MSGAPIYSSGQCISFAGQDHYSIILQKSMISDILMHQEYSNFFEPLGKNCSNHQNG